MGDVTDPEVVTRVRNSQAVIIVIIGFIRTDIVNTVSKEVRPALVGNDVTGCSETESAVAVPVSVQTQTACRIIRKTEIF